MEHLLELTTPNINQILITCALTIFIYLAVRFVKNRCDIYKFGARYPQVSGCQIAVDVIKQPEGILSICGEYFKQFHTYFSWWGWEGLLFTSDPCLIEKVLNSLDMINKSKLYSGVGLFLGPGLVNSTEARWHDHRRKLNSSFNNKTLLSFIPIFNKGKMNICNFLTNIADDGKEHQIEDMIRRITLGVTYETVMGKKLAEGELVKEHYIKAMYKANALAPMSFVTSVFNLEWLLIFGGIEPKLIAEKVLYKLIMQKKSEDTIQEEDHIKNDDNIAIKKLPTKFISEALKFHEAGSFSMSDIIAEANIIVGASFETTSTAILCTIYMLAIHPDLQQRVFEEVRDVLPDKDSPCDSNSFEMMPYLDMFIKETLRLFPPIPMIARRTVRETRILEDLVLPKSLEVIISIYAIHRSVDLWGPNAHQFNPDNFLPENVSRRHPAAFIPFSKGPRNCIGWLYAYYQMKTVLAGVIRMFEFTSTCKFEDLKPRMQMTFCLEKYPAVQIHRRD